MLSKKSPLLNCLKVASFVGLGLSVGNACAAGGNPSSSVGIGLAGFGSSEYKDYSSDVSPIPMVQLEGDYFYFKGLSVGAYLYKDQVNEFSASISYLGKKFDSSDSDDASVQLLDDRDATATADLNYRFSMPKVGSLAIKASVDILDESDGGYMFDVGYSQMLPVSKTIRLMPGAGFVWYNDAFTDHYYGISASEATASGLNEYQPESSFSPYLSLNVNIDLTQAISLFARGQYTLLSDEITDSPMVDSDYSITCMAGLNLKF